MTSSFVLARSLVETSKAAQDYAGSDAIRVVTAMLDALEEAYKDELFDVSPGDLVALQTKLKQTQAIRKVLVKETALPKI